VYIDLTRLPELIRGGRYSCMIGEFWESRDQVAEYVRTQDAKKNKINRRDDRRISYLEWIDRDQSVFRYALLVPPVGDRSFLKVL
jgi:hypothetical protein